MGIKEKLKMINIRIFSVRMFIFAVIILIATVLSLIVPKTLYLDLVIIFAINIIALYMCFKEIKYRKYRINELSKSVDMVLKDNLNLIKVPMVMLTDSTHILWQNSSASHLLPKDYITQTATEIEYLLKENKEAKITETTSLANVYNIIGNKIRFSDFDCILLTYLDITKEVELEKILEDTKVAVGVIFVDNYEETMQGLDDSKKAEISSRLTKELREFVLSYDGVLNKIEKDKYVIFIKAQYVRKMEEESFKILEKIRNMTDETKLPITISIGISYNEDSLNDRYNASSSALDIALGRGGDQAVVKKDKKFEFYGGANLGLEKTNRVRARTIAQALKELIKKSDKVYIMGHKNTDIDCIGGAVGVYKIAKFLGKEANIIIDTKCNFSTKAVIEKLNIDNEYEDVFVTKDDLKKLDFSNSILIVVDTHKKSYVVAPELIEEFEKIVIIDHHRRGPEFIDKSMLNYHEIYASSTSELVTELLMYLEDVKLKSNEAESLYAGIVVDTKNFMFKTGVRTFEVAAYLKKYGIDLSEVKQLFQSDFKTYVAKVDIVKKAQIIRGKIAVSICEDKLGDAPVIVAQAADELLSISGIHASFVLCKVDDIVMISGRSMGDINVQAIMEKIGVGGHLTFAGAQIAGVTIEEAKQKVLDSIDEYFENE